MLLSLAIDRRLDRISSDCKAHLETCSHCQQEWGKIKNWVQVLRAPEPWQPGEDFIQKLTEQSMREKRRPLISESTWRELRLGGAEWHWWDWLFRFPKSATVVGFALLFLLVFGNTAVQVWDTVGNFDYINGNVVVQAATLKNIEVGSRITKGMSIQTAKGAESVLALRDGSEILLSSLSRVSLQDSRQVRLERGTAFFEVEKGKGTFRIQVPYGEITVLGTAFAVTVEDELCTVTVVEGVVECASAQSRIRVQTGYEGVLHNHTAPVLRPTPQTQQTLRWVMEMRKKRDTQELRTYYPSLSGPDTGDRP
jgi:hypothetical protein